MFCDHCPKSQHTRETCWRLLGYPTQGRRGRYGGVTRARANHSSTIPTRNSSTPDNRTLSKEELETLHRPMSQMEPPTTTSSSSAHSGNLASSSNTTSTSNIAESDDLWIIDLGASDHMTSLSSLFSSYHLCSSRDEVKIVDGSLSFVPGKGSILVTPSILHIPNLENNLLSIARITTDWNYQVPSNSIFSL